MAFFAVGLSVVLSKRPARQWIHAKRAHEMLRMPFFIERIDAAARDGFPTPCAERAGLLVVMNFTIWLSAVLVKRTACEGFLAVLADEMLRVPLLAERVDALAPDGLVAGRAARSKGTVKAIFAIGSRVFLEKCAPFKRPQATRANEMIQMPLLVERGHAPVQNRLVAVRAAHAEQLLVTALAMRQAVLFVEIVRAERVLAVSAGEMLRVVGVSHGLNDLAQDRLPALRAGAARRGPAPVDVLHLRGEVLEQVVEVVAAQGFRDGLGAGSCARAHANVAR